MFPKLPVCQQHAKARALSSLYLSMFFRRCHIPFSLAIQRNNSYLPFSYHTYMTKMGDIAYMSFGNRISFPYCFLLCYYNNQHYSLLIRSYVCRPSHFSYFRTSFHSSLPSCFSSALLHRFDEKWIRHISKAAVAHIANPYPHSAHFICTINSGS